MWKHSWTGAALAIFVCAGSLAAQQPNARMARPALQALDLDHDGALSAAEIQQAAQSLLALDKNGDGKLTLEELTPQTPAAITLTADLIDQLMSFDQQGRGFLTAEDLPERMRPLLQRADADHDGKLTRAELQQYAARQSAPQGAKVQRRGGYDLFKLDPILAALDANHDGELAADEIAKAAKTLLALDKNSDGQLTADEIAMRQPSPADRATHMLEEHDADKDGRLSRAEAPGRLQTAFAEIDKNHDGYLDRQELIDYISVQANATR